MYSYKLTCDQSTPKSIGIVGNWNVDTIEGIQQYHYAPVNWNKMSYAFTRNQTGYKKHYVF